MMKFELTNNFISELNEHIENKDQKSIIDMIIECHPADIAEIIDELEFKNASFLFELLEDNIAADRRLKNFITRTEYSNTHR